MSEVLKTLRNIVKGDVITEADLAEVRHIAIVAGGTTSGVNYTTPFGKFDSTYNDFIENKISKFDNRWAIFLAHMNMFKGWHLNKFEYENLPEGIETKTLESFLWTHGSLVIFKYQGEYLALPYISIKHDIYGRPSEVEPYSTYAENTEFEKITIGENGTLINHSEAGLWPSFYTFSDLFKLWPLITDLTNQYQELKIHEAVSKQRIPLGNDVDDATADNLNRALMTGNPAIRFDRNSIAKDLKAIEDGSWLIDFENRSDKIMDVYKFMLDTTSLLIGQKHDANDGKKERKNTSETLMNEHRTNSQIRNQLEIRERDVKIMNKVFDLDVNVSFNEDFLKEITTTPNEQGEDGSVDVSNGASDN